MLKYMTRVRWQDWISSGKELWFENDTGYILTEKVSMYWSFEKGKGGGVLRFVEEMEAL